MRFATWLVINTLYYACVVAGIMGSAGAWAVAVFIIWIYFGAMVILWIIDETVEAKSHPVPAWVDELYDVMVIGTLVWFGHWFYALLYLAVIMMQYRVVRYN